jgi:hypothetical protein
MSPARVRSRCNLRPFPSGRAAAVAAGNPRGQVLIGLPTYGRGLPSHNPRAESLRLGLAALRTSSPPAAAFAGVALFADYATDLQEWQTYDSLWLRP